jgi:hypothetical protein
MPVTDEIFKAFLECETKAFLKFSRLSGTPSDFRDWQCYIAEGFKQKCSLHLRSGLGDGEFFVGTLPEKEAEHKYRLVLDSPIQTHEMQSNLHALERLDSSGKTRHSPYVPVRFIPGEKLIRHDKLLLAFDALSLFTFSGKMPPFGKIIHGSELRVAKVRVAELMKATRSVVRRIAAQQADPATSPPVLKKHCAECEFQSRCRRVAVEKDDLSLLTGMSEKERKKHHDKGIGDYPLDKVRGWSHYTPRWAFLPVEDSDMIRIAVNFFYDVGAAVHPLTEIEQGADREQVFFQMFEAKSLLNGLLRSGLIPMRTCRESGFKLVNAIDAVVNKGPSAGPLEFMEAYSVSSEAKRFETILTAELSVSDSYFVSQKGLYSTIDLIERAEIIFPESIRQYLSSEAVNEVRQAGKCLAFELPTSAGFHILRAAEDVIREYYGELAGTLPQKKARNWGMYINGLRKHGANLKVIAALEQIKDMHRNPIIHPEVTLSMEEAITLFGMVIGAMVAMVMELVELRASKAAAAATPALPVAASGTT